MPKEKQKLRRGGGSTPLPHRRTAATAAAAARRRRRQPSPVRPSQVFFAGGSSSAAVAPTSHSPTPPAAVLVGGKQWIVREAGMADAAECFRLERDLIEAHRDVPAYAKKTTAELWKIVGTASSEQQDKASFQAIRLMVWRHSLSPESYWHTLLTEEAASGHIVGMVHYRRPADKQPWCYLAYLSVEPAFRGCGVGQLLLRRALQLHPRTEWRLDVVTRAEGLYRGGGFPHEISVRWVQGAPWRCLSSRRPKSVEGYDGKWQTVWHVGGAKWKVGDYWWKSPVVTEASELRWVFHPNGAIELQGFPSDVRISGIRWDLRRRGLSFRLEVDDDEWYDIRLTMQRSQRDKINGKQRSSSGTEHVFHLDRLPDRSGLRSE